MILANLSTRDLLLVQRVSRTFKATVLSSLPLRRKLFLVLIAPSADWSGEEVQMNDLLCKRDTGEMMRTKLVNLAMGQPSKELISPTAGSWTLLRVDTSKIGFPHVSVQLRTTREAISKSRHTIIPSWAGMYFSRPAIPVSVTFMELDPLFGHGSKCMWRVRSKHLITEPPTILAMIEHQGTKMSLDSFDAFAAQMDEFEQYGRDRRKK